MALPLFCCLRLCLSGLVLKAIACYLFSYFTPNRGIGLEEENMVEGTQRLRRKNHKFDVSSTLSEAGG